MYKIVRTATVPESLFGLLNGQLRFLSEHYEVVAISSQGHFLKETSEREGVPVIAVNMERGISPFKDFVSLVNLFKVLNKEKPTIVHSITPKAGLLSMLAAKMAGVPIRVHTFTGLIFPSKRGLLRELLILMDRLLCWAATDIFPEGKGVKNDLVKFNITKKPLKIIANGNVNGIDLTYFNLATQSKIELQNLKQQLHIREEDFVYIFVGRLVADKGINELIEAFKTLNSNGDSKLLLVGNYESELDPLEAKTLEEIASNPSIVSVGFQRDVRPYFAISDALVFPSYREGFPNVVIQAGALELPSIVTDINGCNEIIVHKKNGLIIPPKDIKSLIAAMRDIKKDRNQYNLMKLNARNMIESRYQQSVVWEALLIEYKKLIDR